MINFEGQYSKRVLNKHALRVFVLFVFFFAVFFGRILFSDKFLAPEDGRIQNIPAFLSYPTLWTQYLFSGYPAQADPQTQFFYPLAILFSHLWNGWNWFVVMGYVLAASFSYGYFYSLTRARFASTVGAFIFSLSGILVLELRHSHIIHAACYLPLLLWCIEETANSISNKLNKAWFFIGTVTVGILAFVGHMQLFCMTFALIAVYAGVRGLSVKRKDRKRFYAICASMLFLGATIGLAQLLPTWELSRFSNRENFPYSEFAALSMNPFQIHGFLLPFILGAHRFAYYATPLFGSILPPGIFYIGFLPLLILVPAIVLARKSKLLIFWLVVALFSFLLTLGDATLAAKLLYQIPPFDCFRGLYRFEIFTAFALATLTALTLNALQNEAIDRKWTLRSIAVWGGIFIATVYFLNANLDLFNESVSKALHVSSFLPWQNLEIGISLVLFAATALAFATWQFNPKALVPRCLLLGVVLVDLVQFGQCSEWVRNAPDKSYFTPPDYVTQYQEDLDYAHNRLITLRGTVGERGELPPNVCRLWRIPNASGYEPLLSTRYADLAGVNEEGYYLEP